MILGLGTDLCDIRRVEKTLERFGERFAARIYSPAERAKAERRLKPANVLLDRDDLGLAHRFWPGARFWRSPFI